MMVKMSIEEDDGKEKVKLAFVVAEFNYDITHMMLQRAKSHAEFLGAEVVDVIWTPGSFDMPLAIEKLLQKEDVDAVVTLGCVIQGETKHDEVVAQHSARKIMDLSLQYGKPVALGVSGPGETYLQAKQRIDGYAKRSVEAAVKMVKRLK